ncbi:hypothetical protein KAR29_09765 [Aminithiophilus ramosus]|uniref:Uncharacterized protein n=2 Tax=Synergistales TaxID=649776 RepID=A0A9Q7AE13_9BACT|nr:hypothetical protein [Aminithiophilus ramosus]QTX31639.1 hypothetical protein KAR29_09765 [Aminithiophilus ramosus]QVL35446.1 hypothetical protein KIH16_09605 [Synergistota bacterium]
MIRPVEMQLSLWRIEETTHRRNPEAAPAQALQDDEIAEEARHRDNQVQSAEGTEGKRVGEENREKKEGRRGRRRPPRPEEENSDEDEGGGGLDLMA